MYQININLQFCLSNICQWKLFSNELFVSRKGNFIIWQVHLFWHSCRRIHCFLFYWNTVDTYTILCYRSSLAVQWLGLHAVLPTAWVQSLTGELRSYKLHSVAYKNTSMCVCVYQFSSVAQLCPTLWDPMDCSTPGFPVNHQIPELAQTHVHWIGDAIQP